MRLSKFKLLNNLALPNAAGVLFLCTGKILLVKRAPSGTDDATFWSIPGGMIKQRERPWAAAQREVVEELGALPPGWRAPTDRWLWIDKKTKLAYLTFVVELPPTALLWKPTLSDEHTAWLWLDKTQTLKKKLHPGLKNLLNSEIFEPFI